MRIRTCPLPGLGLGISQSVYFLLSVTRGGGQAYSLSFLICAALIVVVIVKWADNPAEEMGEGIGKATHLPTVLSLCILELLEGARPQLAGSQEQPCCPLGN